MSIASMAWVLILSAVRYEWQSVPITDGYMYRTILKEVLATGQIYSLNDARYFDCGCPSVRSSLSQACKELSDAKRYKLHTLCNVIRTCTVSQSRGKGKHGHALHLALSAMLSR